MPERRLLRPSNRALVLFGATGDLAARKLFPGFFHLYREGLMPEDFRIIGSGRHSPGSDEDFREHVRHALQEHGRIELDDHWDKFAKRLSFVVSSADDGSDLAQAVTDAESEVGAEGERLIYLSVPPAAMQAMVAMLGNTGIAERCSLVVEKPFGHDVASALRRRRRSGGLRAPPARCHGTRAAAVHPRGSDRAAVGGLRPGHRDHAEAPALREGIVGTGRGPGSHRTTRLAAARRQRRLIERVAARECLSESTG
jgi:hypothetical protein